MANYLNQMANDARCAVCHKLSTHFWNSTTGTYACTQEHARLRDEWDVRCGVITRPGKFEGQHAYMVQLYDAYLDGFADDRGDHITVEVTPAEQKEFPALKRRAPQRRLSFTITDQGFVQELL